MTIIHYLSAVLRRYINTNLKENFGTIIKSSSNGCKLFGYTQNELWGKHIDSLFLDIYSGNISNYIKNLINDWDNEKTSKIDYFYGKIKSHHSILLKVELIDNKKIISDKVHFLVLISSEFNLVDLKQYKKSCHFIINSNLQIYNYSVQVIELLYLLNGKVPNDFNSLHSLFPELCLDSSKDSFNENNHRISDTILNECLLKDGQKIELFIKSRTSGKIILNV